MRKARGGRGAKSRNRSGPRVFDAARMVCGRERLEQRFRVAYACASSVRILIRGNRSSVGKVRRQGAAMKPRQG